MNSVPDPASQNPPPSRGKVWVAVLTTAPIAALTLYQYLLWRAQPFPAYYLPLVLPHRWVSPSDMFGNFVRIFQGYTEGYLRTAYGYFIFAMMALAFAGAGKPLLLWIFRRRNPQFRISSLHPLERIALYPLLGSLVYSMLWLGLGSLGWLHPAWAAAVLVAGVAVSVKSLNWRSCTFNRARDGVLQTFETVSRLEKVWILFLGIVALGLSTFAVHPQTHVDVLFSTLGLPEFYAAWGRVMTYPYHIYSYMTQGTEMLVLWAVLLKSEVAAALLVWGFFLALLAWVAGFFRRTVCGFTALLTVTLLMAAPVVIHQTIKLKTDIPVTVFLFTHFCALAEFLERRRRGDAEARAWLILAGLLGGGAVAHKLLAVPVVFCSTLLIVGYDLARRRSGGKDWDFPVWLLALAIPCLPWLLRTLFATGNPFYPFLIDWFGGHRVKPWHKMQGGETFAVEGWRGFARYFRFLSFEEKEPLWGPTVLFALWTIGLWRGRKDFGWRWALAVAWLSWLASIPAAFQVRFHMGMFAFITCASFALFWEDAFREGFSALGRGLILAIAALYLGYIYSFAKIWRMWAPSVAIACSGYSPGSFELNNVKLQNWLWLCHLINTRTQPDETFACLEMVSGYGLRRPYYFNFGYDKPLVLELAESAQNAEDLKNQLRARGIQHLLVEDGFENSQWYFPVQKREAALIHEMLDRWMVLRLKMPDGSVGWYTFRENAVPILQVDVNPQDAAAFPLAFSDQAVKAPRVAHAMLVNLLKIPLPPSARIHALYWLGYVYSRAGDEVKAESTLRSAVDQFPGQEDAYFNLASYYQSRGPSYFTLAAENYRRATQLAPRYGLAYASLGLIYYQMREYGLALQTLERAIALNPFDADAYNNLGNTLLRLGRLHQALENYRTAIELFPGFTAAHNNLGFAHLALGENRKAEEEIRRALELDPTYALAVENLGDLCFRENRRAEARAAYQRLLELDPKNRAAKERLARLR